MRLCPHFGSMYHLASLVWALLLTFPPSAHAQTLGCTDPQALNYNSSAISNDGSCQYAPTSYSPTLLTTLSDTIRETSGVAWIGGLLWTHNDSGDMSFIYALDTLDGTVLRRVFLANAPHLDWEDAAQSETHLFIGDFGNNQGNRTNLRIYKVPIDSLLLPDVDTVHAESITFYYPDQLDFTPAPNNHDFDAEALFYWGNSLHLFTKNWKSQNTRYYTLPAAPGHYAATLMDSMDCQGLITGAAIHSGGKEIVLCGYQNIGFGLYVSFAWLLFDYVDFHPFSGNKRRIELGTALQTGQMEAVWLKDDLSGWITGEAISSGPFNQPARLSSFQFKDFFISNPTSTQNSFPKKRVTIFPNPATLLLNLELHEYQDNPLWQLLDSNGILHQEGRIIQALTTIDIQGLISGYYVLRILGRNPEVIPVIIMR